MPRIGLLAASVAIAMPSLISPEPGRAQERSRTAVTWEAGSGDGVELWRIGVQRSPRTLTTVASWVASVAWEFQLGRWSGATGRATGGIWDVGLTPLVRLERPAASRWTTFLEGAVGAHLISRNRVHDRLDMSSAYQFGDHVGIGVRFRAMEVVFRHQHMSNGSTVQPNPGANFNMIRLVYYLR